LLARAFVIDQNILFWEYALTSIFLFGYTRTMKTLWTALTEPNRFHIVELLRDGPLTVGEITERLGLQQPQVSKHLKVLSEAGIVEVQPQANRRIYTLRREPFQELEAWLHSFRRLWEERFDRLDDYLLELQTTEQHTSNRIEDNHV
jgi:DNA-binding transcriptional ArsR family regulator